MERKWKLDMMEIKFRILDKENKKLLEENK